MEPIVERRGNGRPLLLLHSGFCTWVEFRHLIDDLAHDHEVIAPTLPGSFGGPVLDVSQSMLAQHVEYAESLIADSGWSERPLVVGSSFGGVAALELLARAAAGRAIALAPPWTTGAALPFYGVLFSGLPALKLSRAFWPRTTRSGLINGLWLHQSRTPPLIDPKDVEELLESWSQFPVYKVGRAAGRRGPGMPDLSKIKQSVATLVWGGRDFLVPTWMRRRWQAELPEANTIELPGFPHQPHLRSPSTIAALIRAEEREADE